MDIYSQPRLKVAATEPEHSVRKAEFDQTIGGLNRLKSCNKSNLVDAINEFNRVFVGAALAVEHGRATVQLLDASGEPNGNIIHDVILLPVSVAVPSFDFDTDTSDLICRARQDNPLNHVEIV
ncbi:MAG: hypothetical protein LBC02_12270 [Planctomycetaceae bacterium]|jgi:hypothetical protein|nr:hypothetical protein [Planctomycetaceae bacterium]